MANEDVVKQAHFKIAHAIRLKKLASLARSDEPRTISAVEPRVESCLQRDVRTVAVPARKRSR